MVDPALLLESRLREALDRLGDGFAGADPALRPSERADFQVDGALAMARRVGRPPREVAQQIADAADLSGMCSHIEVSGPGFVNLTLADEWIAELLLRLGADDRLGVATVAVAEVVVVDYSSPNVAKEMHVGHLRSTILGDALVRLFEWLGHRVIRHNHLGDWGTPFGMLIEHLVDLGEEEAAAGLSVGDLDGFYRQAREKFDSDPAFADRSRRRVVQLQAGDAETLRLWAELVEMSSRYFDMVYQLLGVWLRPEDTAAESSYNSELEDLVGELKRLGLLVEDQGALCVFPEGALNREGVPLPLIVRKSDGGFGYAATDLAAIRRRVCQLGATLVLYVVGAPQRDHLQMVFTVARAAGWLTEGREAHHVAFGSVLGGDRRMLRSRAGQAVKLVDLLEEAVQRAAAVVKEKNPGLDADEQARVARAVGIGAVKYADLSSERIKDYVFDWDAMLSFEGNTGPYLQYAHARVMSVLRKGSLDERSWVPPAEIRLDHPAERSLALALLGFERTLHQVAAQYQPHRLCGYLFEVASEFSVFYESCPILRAETPLAGQTRLLLAVLTARTLRQGLALLGMEAPEAL